jgi:hypothetical protein
MTMKRTLLLVIGIFFLLILGASTAMRMSPRFAIGVQRAIGVIGSELVVGNAELQTQPEWLLISCKKLAGDHFRFYGILPIPDSWTTNTLPGPYYAFADISGSEPVRFAIAETDPAFNRRLKSWLTGESSAAFDRRSGECGVESSMFLGTTVIRCKTPGEQVVYVPKAGVTLFVRSDHVNLERYLNLKMDIGGQGY